MRQTRIFIDQPVGVGTEISLDERAAHHVVRVLRHNVGDRVEVFNRHGCQALAEIILADRRRGCRVRILESIESDRESPIHTELVQAVARGDKVDRVIRQAVELGVSAIRPLITRYCEVRSDQFDRRLHRWREIVINAGEQSGRSRLPAVHAPVTPTELICEAQTRLMLVPEAETSLIQPLDAEGGIAVAIGPEGGLAPEDIKALQGRGFESRRMGPRILRTETAGLAALAIVQARFGDFGDCTETGFNV